MRTLLALVVAPLLSLNLIACAADDESNEPAHDVVVNPLVKEGGECKANADCASSRCLIAESNLGIKGFPAPVCEGKDCDTSDDDSNVATKGKPLPNDPGGKIEPQPAPAPTPSPTPAPQPSPQPFHGQGIGVCAG